MIEAGRVRKRNDLGSGQGRYVLYWMQQAQRAAGNPALEVAIAEANRLSLPVIVGFGLMDDYPHANRRHYTFMLQGLQATRRSLCERGLELVVRRGHRELVEIGDERRPGGPGDDRARGRRGCPDVGHPSATPAAAICSTARSPSPASSWTGRTPASRTVVS